MSFQEDTQGMRSAIEAEMQLFIDRTLPAEYPELRGMLTYHMGWEGEGAGPDAQGKRIRPLLVLLCTEAAGGEWRRALPAAVAVELLHNFSLIHDDIQDNSPLRRSRPTVWVKWGAAQSINAGDVMFTLAFLAIQELAFMLPPQDVLLASRTLLNTCLRLTEGQYLDISYEKNPKLPMDAYWPMIGGKTSALLACCCELGALVAGVSEERRAAFHAYGYSLGLAFQVLDDWLGIWGDTVLTGKSAESDLVSGKKTLPVVYALSKEGAFARRWMEGAIRPEEVPALARLLEEEGAHAYTLQTAEKLTQQALDSLCEATAASQDDCTREAAQALQALTQALLQRKS
jgi:geranylgeranyl diphosphate synthase, type I